MDDELTLVARCLAWDERAWREFANRYGRFAAARAARVLAVRLGRADPTLVQEAVQETFLRLAAGRGRLLARFAWRSKLSTYVSAVAGFAALDLVRKSARSGLLEERIDLTGFEGEARRETDPLRMLLDREASARMEKALADLSLRDRLVVRMRFWDGAEAGVIARVLELDPAYVRVLLGRALEKLKKNLSAVDTPDDDRATHG